MHLPIQYHPFQNQYFQEMFSFELFMGLQLQLSGVCRIKHYNYSVLHLLSERSYKQLIPPWIFKNLRQLQLIKF